MARSEIQLGVTYLHAQSAKEDNEEEQQQPLLDASGDRPRVDRGEDGEPCFTNTPTYQKMNWAFGSRPSDGPTGRYQGVEVMGNGFLSCWLSSPLGLYFFVYRSVRICPYLYCLLPPSSVRRGGGVRGRLGGQVRTSPSIQRSVTIWQQVHKYFAHIHGRPVQILPLIQKPSFPDAILPFKFEWDGMERAGRPTGRDGTGRDGLDRPVKMIRNGTDNFQPPFRSSLEISRGPLPQTDVSEDEI